jgi:hypothetical protein
MAKSLFYRLFGFGRLPETLKLQLESEGIIYLDEGVGGSVTYRNFHRPGRYSNWEKRGMVGSIVLTGTRLLALRGKNTIINVPLTDKRIRSMQFSVEKGEKFCVAFDASLFQPDWSGTIEYRFRTEQAQRLLQQLQEQISIQNR